MTAAAIIKRIGTWLSGFDIDKSSIYRYAAVPPRYLDTNERITYQL
jgi:hypothetical protein